MGVNNMSLDIELLRKHIEDWKAKLAQDPQHAALDKQERTNRVIYYQAQTPEKIRNFTEDEFYEYISKLWAMLIWGNKKYVVDKLINDNGFKAVKNELAELVWGSPPIEKRWDHFRSAIKGMGPAMMSEFFAIPIRTIICFGIAVPMSVYVTSVSMICPVTIIRSQEHDIVLYVISRRP